MVGLSIIAVLLFVVLLCVVINKYGVPEMVSSIYYLLGKRGWVFQLLIIAFGATMMMCLLDSGLGEQCLAFIACAGLMFVGFAPRFLDESERRLHKGAAVVSAVASVSWCLTVDWQCALAFMSWYCVYWACKDEDSKPWLTAEVTAILLVMVTYWRNVLV